MSTPIGDPRPAGQAGAAGDQRPPGSDAPAGDPRHAGDATHATSFDPSTHTVAEVQDYLSTADEDDIDRVLDSERAGKNRSSLVG